MRYFYRDTDNGRQYLCLDCFETSPYVAVTMWASDFLVYLLGTFECRDCGTTLGGE